MKIRVSDYIAKYLEDQGVRAVFLLSGGGMMHLLDSISRSEKIRYFCNHHEQASSIAADAYARKTGGLGVCYATSGPGATNTLTGVVGAWQDSSPVLYIAGQSKVSQTIQGTGLHGLRQFGTFEVDIIPIVKSITKYSAFISDPKSIRYHLEKACYLALSGRPGPVFLDIPVDVQGAPIDPDELEGYTPVLEPALAAPSRDVIQGVIERLKNAKRPLILAGHGIRCANLATEFRALIKKLNVPVVTTPFATDLLEYNDPLFVGHPGTKGDRPGNFAIQTADVILSIGSSFHVMTTGYELDQFAPKAYKIQVEPDEHVLKREQVGVQQKIHCYIQDFARELNAQVSAPVARKSSWHDYCSRIKTELAVSHEKFSTPPGEINYYDLIHLLGDLTQGNETLVTDAGSGYYTIGQAYRIKGSQRVINSGSLGSMGFALPATTGACAGDLSAQVICVTGDGSLQTNIHEFAVIRKNNFNAKVFIVNNGGYVSIRNTQNSFFAGHLAGTDPNSGVMFPNLKTLAEAYSIPYLAAKTKAELAGIVRETLAMTGPVICEVFTPTKQEILPTVSSVRLENGSMKSKPLHEMFPFMDEKTVKSYMPEEE